MFCFSLMMWVSEWISENLCIMMVLLVVVMLFVLGVFVWFWFVKEIIFFEMMVKEFVVINNIDGVLVVVGDWWFD